MARPKEENLSAPEKHDRARGLVIHPAAEKLTELRASPGFSEIMLSRARFNVLIDKQRLVSKLLADYADIVEMAERDGRATSVRLEVQPGGQAALIAANEEGDALDAALAAAKGRGAAKISEILKGEDMLTARQFGPLIGASHETVNAWRKSGEVLGLEGATRGVKYPRWQVTDAGLPLPGLAQVFAVLGMQPWTVYRFLRAAHAELNGRTALDSLKAGEVEAVLGVARNQAAGAFS